MHIEDIRDYCLAKSDSVVEETPFGPDTLVFKIGGKVFLLIGLDQIEDLRFNVKCDPEYAVELREKYEQTVFPGYHMNKKHWNTVVVGRELNTHQLTALIDHSFDLVIKALPKALRDSIK
ncbi:MAG: MmcQ/YjbR family DNA-binding protein [Sphingobacterium composti]|uniref:MmcQ/YjbR family DNA-binding protein n=1 Tax=Sphingobacterium composti TaxID=363260 RepID=UPI001357B0ED|nr:MmcQ/YjbR family DNA-binding protein [Sphingobacterium composti Ten et al. 2007 non Yoo et al. 2007]